MVALLMAMGRKVGIQKHLVLLLLVVVLVLGLTHSPETVVLAAVVAVAVLHPSQEVLLLTVKVTVEEPRIAITRMMGAVVEAQSHKGIMVAVTGAETAMVARGYVGSTTSIMLVAAEVVQALLVVVALHLTLVVVEAALVEVDMAAKTPPMAAWVFATRKTDSRIPEGAPGAANLA
jgi:hypothetical protein